jgi:hypothetical protein
VANFDQGGPSVAQRGLQCTCSRRVVPAGHARCRFAWHVRCDLRSVIGRPRIIAILRYGCVSARSRVPPSCSEPLPLTSRPAGPLPAQPSVQSQSILRRKQIRYVLCAVHSYTSRPFVAPAPGHASGVSGVCIQQSVWRALPCRFKRGRGRLKRKFAAKRFVRFLAKIKAYLCLLKAWRWHV